METELGISPAYAAHSSGNRRKQRLQMLQALDNAKTQGYHFTTIIIAGMGFFTDAYDLICVSTVTKLLGRIYYTDPTSAVPGALPPGVNASINGIALVGAFVGQLFFGWLGDRLGRKKVYGITALLMIGSSIASGLSFGSKPHAVIATICFFRFWLGIGIGGDYPLSATIMSEYSNTATRGAFVGAVFANQGLGILVSAAVASAVSAILRSIYPAPAYAVDPIASTSDGADYLWRIVFVFGCVPAALTYYWRSKMPETPRYTALVAGDTKRAAADMERVLHTKFEMDVEGSSRSGGGGAAAAAGGGGGRRGEGVAELLTGRFWKKHGAHLVGTSTTWFLAGLPWYTLNLFEKDVLTAVRWLPEAATMSAIDEVYKVAGSMALIALCSIVPGYWVTILLIDRIGRKPIQLLGFFMITVFLLALGIPYDHWRDHNHIGFVIIYAFTFFFCNFGPNTTTFIVPAEIFPARIRTTCHGISAAVGKLGAILGAFGFTVLSQDPDPALVEPGYKPGIGVGKTFTILAATSFLGFLLTFLIPEPMGLSLEEISGDANASVSYHHHSSAAAAAASADARTVPLPTPDREGINV